MLELRQPLLPRRFSVGNIIDGPAKSVDLEDRLAADARQNAHRRVERAP
jgi:hypothetical protein